MWLYNKTESANAHKCNVMKRIQIMSIIQLVSIIMVMVSIVSGDMRFPAEKSGLMSKDFNGLLKPDFMTFCNGPNTHNTGICSMYYDMVYNVYELNPIGMEVGAALLAASEELDKPELSKVFCDILRNETTTALDKQPFSMANGIKNVSEWIHMVNVCELNCIDLNKNKINDVCKYISGGFKWIFKQKNKNSLTDISSNAKISNVIDSAKINDVKDEMKPLKQKDENEIANANGNGNEKKNVNENPLINQDAQQNLNPSKSTNSNGSSSPTSTKEIRHDQKTIQATKQLENSVPAPISDPQKPVESTPKLIKNSTVNAVKISNDANNENVDPVEPVDSVNNQSDDDDANNDKKTELNDDENEDDAGAEDEDQVAQGDLNTNTNLNSNSIRIPQSHFDSDQEIREDKESSFFPYFMFSMFVVVAFYVAYHNKSKILALLIEGRRSRNFSSRGGNRRKQHSAEYRKLDSNLEEAIQSDRGHVMSTQIIY